MEREFAFFFLRLAFCRAILRSLARDGAVINFASRARKNRAPLSQHAFAQVRLNDPKNSDKMKI